MKLAFVMVLYSELPDFPWTKISIQSFRKHFPEEPLFVVDQNGYANERLLCETAGAKIIGDGRKGHHALGVHKVLDVIRSQYDAFIHIEPDCLFTGRGWYEQIVAALNSGYWMAGPSRLPYGPLHPCPSGWVLDKLPGRFDYQPQGQDLYHSKYGRLVNIEVICNEILRARSHHAKQVAIAKLLYWDVGLKNWFDCAVVEKAIQTNSEGFRHFWFGRNRSPQQWLAENQNALQSEFSQYLDVSVGNAKLFI